MQIRILITLCYKNKKNKNERKVTTNIRRANFEIQFCFNNYQNMLFSKELHASVKTAWDNISTSSFIRKCPFFCLFIKIKVIHQFTDDCFANKKLSMLWSSQNFLLYKSST